MGGRGSLSGLRKRKTSLQVLLEQARKSMGIGTADLQQSLETYLNNFDDISSALQPDVVKALYAEMKGLGFNVKLSDTGTHLIDLDTGAKIGIRKKGGEWIAAKLKKEYKEE